MSDIECDVKIEKTRDEKAKDDSVTVIMKGEQYVSFVTGMGFDVTDQVEFSLTVKCGSMATARHLGIAAVWGGTKKVVLRDRDMSLQSFDGLEGAEIELHPAMQQKIV